MQLPERFSTRMQAESAAAVLRSAGIEAEVHGADASGAAPFLALGSSHGFRVDVGPGSYNRALEILQDLRWSDPAEPVLGSTPLRQLVTGTRIALGVLVLLVGVMAVVATTWP